MMNLFIGSKLINAEPMERMLYNDLRGWVTPEDECPHDEGYLVEYLDGGKPCHPAYKGYISWSPKDVFENAYKKSGEMTFGDALECLKRGMKVARAGWNGKGMFLFLVQGSTFQVNRPPLLGIYPEGTTINYCPHIDMKTADDKVVPWLASQTDMLADDWGIIE